MRLLGSSCALLAAAALTAGGCASESGVAGGSGGGGAVGSAGSSGWPSTSGGSGGGTGGTASLPCDPGFVFAPDPPETASPLAVAFTHAEPLTYVELKVSGPSSPQATGGPITTSDPWTWNWTVTGLSPGLHGFEFWAGDPSARIATCEKNVTDTGRSSGGSGGGGGGGSGGSGGHCCGLVGTDLANASPCGPSAAASPWKTLDNAGCHDGGGCKKIWCPFEKCDPVKHPNGCPQGTEACWVGDQFATYEDACKSCCESYGACWDAALSTCRHPDDCGLPLGLCPWQ